MPVYSYRCNDPKCGGITDHLHTIGQKPKVPCETCDGPTHSIIVETPHVKFDYKAWYTAEEGTRLVLHRSSAGKRSPASEVAGGRT